MDKYHEWIDRIRKEVPEIYDYENTDYGVYFYMQVEEKVRVAQWIPHYFYNPDVGILLLKETLEKAKKREIPVVDYNLYNGGFGTKMDTPKPTISELSEKIRELTSAEVVETTDSQNDHQNYRELIQQADYALRNAVHDAPRVAGENMSIAFSLNSIAYSLLAIAKIMTEE